MECPLVLLEKAVKELNFRRPTNKVKSSKFPMQVALTLRSKEKIDLKGDLNQIPLTQPV
jgi:hypothetical protein